MTVAKGKKDRRRRNYTQKEKTEEPRRKEMERREKWSGRKRIWRVRACRKADGSTQRKEKIGKHLASLCASKEKRKKE